ncbi:DUF6584 family protein [Kitasatospora sp. NPDC094011]|uniref:DUF6584 family protein n=1 Tax=Kitasatospora sp. NPDC094011 TaxID=3364090 RepID=UPI003803BBE7
MTVESTLVKVDADLRSGRIPLARQRLRGLVVSYPADLTARRRLAEVYRLYSEPAEAGRWTYLDEERDPDETAAFEARYGDPLHRMAAVAWRGPEESAPTAAARARLAVLREAAALHLGHPVDWRPLPEPLPHDGRPDGQEDSGRLFCAALATVGALLAGFAVLGVVTFVGWWF